jgi:hypothetical protein
VKIKRHFCIQVQRISQARKQREGGSSACYMLHADFLRDLFFDPEDEGDIFLRNVG